MFMTEKTPVERITTWIGSTPSLILHTIFFIVSFLLSILGVLSWNRMLLILTTVVSLEAIYLAIFIQMTVNRQAIELAEVGEDVEDIQEDLEEISHDVDEIQEDIEEINEEDAEEDRREMADSERLEQLSKDLRSVLAELEYLKQGK